MIHRARSLEINAMPEVIWAELARYMHVDEFAPFVVSVDALTSGDDGLGSTRRNNFANGTSITEEVIEWVPNRKMGIKGSEFGTLPFRSADAIISLAPASRGKTKVTWSLDYTVKNGFFGWLLGQTIMKYSLGKVIDANLKGLAKSVST